MTWKLRQVIHRSSQKILSTLIGQRLSDLQKSLNIVSLLTKWDPTSLSKITAANLIKDSKSQTAQDIFVLSVFGPSFQGQFVEAGACDGEQASNTLLLEQKFGWSGILVEPNDYWRDRGLVKKRESHWFHGCLAGTVGHVEFVNYHAPELSGIKSHFRKRKKNQGTEKLKESINIVTLMAKFNMSRIDYLSLDTEGSEYEILEAINLAKNQIGVITVEHNFNYTNREKIFAHLTKFGYQRVFTSLSNQDDWYVSRALSSNVDIS